MHQSLNFRWTNVLEHPLKISSLLCKFAKLLGLLQTCANIVVHDVKTPVWNSGLECWGKLSGKGLEQRFKMLSEAENQCSSSRERVSEKIQERTGWVRRKYPDAGTTNRRGCTLVYGLRILVCLESMGDSQNSESWWILGIPATFRFSPFAVGGFVGPWA
jgi:hypothetical protein